LGRTRGGGGRKRVEGGRIGERGMREEGWGGGGLRGG
jgi:hypothetical protein